jgi:RNA polymerase sigma-70 factor (ECF subfamily)
MHKPAATMSVDQELELARYCASGSQEAQRELFRQQRAQVHRTLFRIMGSNRHMEDLVQDTFVEVLSSIGSFAGRSSLATWVDTVAARVAYRYLSRRESRARYIQAVDDLPSPIQDPERQGTVREAMRRLYAALDRIDPKYRIAYTLHVVDGRPIREVARITRTSTVIVKSRIWRARRMMNERANRDPVLSEFLMTKVEIV